jgi:hypothetical protein
LRGVNYFTGSEHLDAREREPKFYVIIQAILGDNE